MRRQNPKNLKKVHFLQTHHETKLSEPFQESALRLIIPKADSETKFSEINTHANHLEFGNSDSAFANSSRKNIKKYSLTINDIPEIEAHKSGIDNNLDGTNNDHDKPIRILSMSFSYSDSEVLQKSSGDSIDKFVKLQTDESWLDIMTDLKDKNSQELVTNSKNSGEQDESYQDVSSDSSYLSPPPINRKNEKSSVSSEEMVPNSIETVHANFSKIFDAENSEKSPYRKMHNSCELPTYKSTHKQTENLIPNWFVKKTSQLTVIYLEDGTKMFNQYRLVELLSKETLCKTYLAIDNEMKKFILKSYNKRKLQRKLLGNSLTAMISVEAETSLVSKLKHKNIQRIIEIIDSSHLSKLIRIEEFASNAKFRRKVPLSADEARRLLIQLTSVLDYLHNDACISHLNITPETLSYDIYGNLKLTNFSYAQPIINGKDEVYHYRNKSELRAPEIKSTRRLFKSKFADIWGIGVCLHFMLYGNYPSINKNENSDKRLNDLLEKLLEEDPERRISLNNLKEHSWVKLKGRESIYSSY